MLRDLQHRRKNACNRAPVPNQDSGRRGTQQDETGLAHEKRVHQQVVRLLERTARQPARAGGHRHGGEVDRLQPRTAEPVERHPGHVERPAGGKHGVARDVRALLADLRHAADDHVLDVRRQIASLA